jgi:enoyl reductase-like protein
MTYEQEVARYNALVNDTIAHPEKLNANLVEIRAVNQRLARILDEMLADAHNTRGTSAAVRDELTEKLNRIQRDYNGLLQNTDKLETLRRIRKGETENWSGGLAVYILAFLAVAIVAIFLAMFTRQNAATIPTTPMIATASPTFI